MIEEVDNVLIIDLSQKFQELGFEVQHCYFGIAYASYSFVCDQGYTWLVIHYYKNKDIYWKISFESSEIVYFSPVRFGAIPYCTLENDHARHKSECSFEQVIDLLRRLKC